MMKVRRNSETPPFTVWKEELLEELPEELLEELLEDSLLIRRLAFPCRSFLPVVQHFKREDLGPVGRGISD